MNSITNNGAVSVRENGDNSCCFRELTGGALRLIFEITRKCNLFCSHCMVSADAKQTSVASHERLIKLMGELKQNNVSKIMFTGGEPLLVDNIADYIGLASNDGIIVDLNSNLTLANDSMISKLCEAGVAEVTTSIDGKEETHCMLRGNKNAYSNTVRAIKSFVQKNVVVDVVCTLMNSNINETQDIVKMCESIGVASVTFSGLIIDGRANKSQATYTIEKVKHIIGELRQTSSIPIRTVRLLNNDYSCCHKGIDMIGISYDGGIHPCLQDKFETTINISNHSLAECISYVRDKSCGICKCYQ